MSPLHRTLPWIVTWRRFSSMKSTKVVALSTVYNSQCPVSHVLCQLNNFICKDLCGINGGPLPKRFHSTSSTGIVSHAIPLSKTECLSVEQRAKEEVQHDWEYICDPRNREEIQLNIINRKGVGNIDLVLDLWEKLQLLSAGSCQETMMMMPEYSSLRKSLFDAAANLPNRSHSDVPVGDESNAQQVALCGQQREFSFKPKSAMQLAEGLGILRTQYVGLGSGPSTYYFRNDLAQLEQALVQYTLDNLLSKGFSFISVPDLVSAEVIEGCGFKTTGIRTQVYKLKKETHGDVCLAGTGEIPIAGLFRNKVLKLSDLPKRVCTISHCYRAEAANIERERGLYRVHQFTKVEMFGITADVSHKESNLLLKEILNIQQSLFEGLGLHFRILNMPSEELGAPAFQKFDMETWLPAKQFWGEISSASNCTDYQSRRLGIKYEDTDGSLKHCHTVNGTACAVPRLIISILENCQNSDGSVTVPSALQPYFGNLDLIKKSKTFDSLIPNRQYHLRSFPGENTF